MKTKALACIAVVFIAGPTFGKSWLKRLARVIAAPTIVVLQTVEKVTPITTQSARKAATKAVDDTVQAAAAAAKYADQERRIPVETFDGALHQKNPAKSLEFLATHPVKQTNKNAQQAMRSSPVLAAAASVAAGVYGGPAGSAAFAAWTTYNATGNIGAAIKVGVTEA